MKIATVLLLVFSGAFASKAQPLTHSADSVFSIESFLNLIAKNHPLIRQTRLADELAQAEIRQARGAFDPKLESHFLRKSYDGKDYYNLFNPELKIPTLPGIDLKAGFERNAGSNVNEEDKTPSGGLRYVGINLPLGRGLLTDARRNSLRQASEARNLTAAEISKNINKILFSASKDYWEWYAAHFQLQNTLLALSLANTRYEAVLRRIRIGELPKIDSLEARIFVQDREILLNQVRQDEQNARTQLSTHLWSEDEQVLDLLPGSKPAVPETWKAIPAESQIRAWADQAKENHPEIQKFLIKTRLLELDRKLAAEMLKPSLNLQYNWLSAPNPGLWYDSPVNRNYKMGMDFSFPLLIRKERAKISLVKTKILQNRLETDQTARNIQAEIRISENQLLALSQNIEAQRTMVSNYDLLLQAEIRKFGIGESSLFLLNSREAKLIESRMKLISLETKFQKERANLLYAAGRNPLMP